jgi:hypothetical protein
MQASRGFFTGNSDYKYLKNYLNFVSSTSSSFPSKAYKQGSTNSFMVFTPFLARSP